MIESRIESRVCKALWAKGAIAHKLTGQVGDPDRIVVWLDSQGLARVFYLELKTKTGRLSKAQVFRHKQLLANTYIVRSVEESLIALENEKNANA